VFVAARLSFGSKQLKCYILRDVIVQPDQAGGLCLGWQISYRRNIRLALSALVV